MTKNSLFGIVIPLLLFGAGVAIYVAMRPPEPPKVPPLGTDPASLLSKMSAAKVQRVLALAEKSETLDIPVSGTVVPYREIELAAEAAGKVIEKDIAVRNGSYVKQGQLLLRIDPRDYELEVERLTRRRDQELAALQELKQDIENSQRLIEVADQEYALADQEVARMESLGANVTSLSELDQAKRARLSSTNQRITLQNQIRTFESRISRLELAIRLAETELEQAKLDLERTYVRAPVTGRIVSENVEADSFVQRGTPLLTIEDTSKVEVAVSLRMDQLYWVLDQANLSADQLVNAAQASRYTLPPIPVKVRFNLSGRDSIKYEWDGRLDRYEGAGLDPQSRTVPIRVVVDQPEEFRINDELSQNSLRSGPQTLVRGMFVEVIIKARPTTQLLLVPKLGIKPATGTNRIWKFESDEAAFEMVKKQNAKLIAVEGNQEDQTNLPDAAPDIDRTMEINPADWRAGFLKVLDGIQVVGAFDCQTLTEDLADDVEYWICEVNGNALAPGDYVVVTPLPGIAGDGSDTVRVSTADL